MVLQTAQPDADPNQTGSFAAARQHLLTVNVEEYFQVGVFRKFISSDHWYRFESRLRNNIDQLLRLLEQHRTKATFFVLGWTAEHDPDLVRSIVAAGHEVASRGFLHQSLTSLPRELIRQDLRRSKAVLEDVTGQPVNGFRMSDGWLSHSTLWMLDEVAAAGYRYDSSLMPRRGDFGSDPKWRSIHEVQTVHGPLLEVPLTTVPVPGGWLPISGGNYQRQLPDFLMRRLVEHAVESDDAPFVMYFQVWELDDQQPRLSVADLVTRLRHYRNLGKYRRILPQYLDKYAFTSVRDHALAEDSPLHSVTREIPRNIPRSSIDSSIRRRMDSGVQVHAAETPFPHDSDTTAGDRIPVTVVVPCFNEEKSLVYLANTLTSVTRKLSDRYLPRFLFVDDCSTDDTFAALQTHYGTDSAVTIVRHDVNQGVSAAILTGLRNAETDIVCSMDCDCTYDPHELSNMLPLLTDDVSMVTASPYHRDGHVCNVPGWRLFLSRGLSFIYQRLLKQELATWTSCFRVYRKNDILDLPLHENGFLGTAELAAQLVLHRRIIREHPATLSVRLFGFSKMKTVRAILSHLRLLARIAASRMKGAETPQKQEAVGSPTGR
ncbi:MAG: glycosyltransferase [Planctomycetaceae bacterium]